MNYFDFTFGIILVSAFVFGVVKGIVRQLFSIIALFLGVYCAFKFSGFVGYYISQWLPSDEVYTKAIAFTVIFLFVIIGVIFTGRLAERFISFAALGFFNRFLGGIFAMAKIIFISCVLLYIAEKLNSKHSFFNPKDMQASFCYKPLKEVGDYIFPYLHW